MKVWFITGANRGLGRAFAEEAVKNGDCVIAAMRKMMEHDSFYRQEQVFPVQMDVTNQEQIQEAVAAGIQKFGRIDVLINNAGFGMNGALEEVSDHELRMLFDTDCFGLVNVIREVLPHMRKQQSGKILNLASQAGMVGGAGCTPYNAVKFAVVGLSEGLNEELKDFNIQAAAVCPGAFRTDFRDSSSLKLPENPMQEYDGTSAHNMLQFMTDNNHKQVGDPGKAASFIYKLLQRPELPVHITVGRGCCDLVRESLLRTIKEMDSYYEESVDTEL